jgi:glycosyltransferase involved in cell wall biosynthesis
MKIAIFNWRDIKHPQAGGAELYFYELAKRWISWGNEVTWFTSMFEGAKKLDKIDGMNIVRSGGKFSVYLKSPIAYLNSKKDFDVIIDSENGIPFFTPLFAKPKIILHMHHLHKEVWFKEMPFPMALLGYFLETKMVPFIYRKSRIITVSKSSADEIIREKFTRFKPEVVNPGIEFYRYKKFARTKRPSILFLNRIKKYKGIQILLDAVCELKNKGFDKFDVFIAGSGDDLERMKCYAKERKLDNVKFLGRISEEKKKELMQKAWVFVNPSFKEGWGIVNIEANYFGTPVIGSNVGGIKDSVLDGKTGLLFSYGNSKELANKIKYLIENKNLSKKMSKEAKKWAMNFDWDSKARSYLNMLNKIAKS